MTPTERIEAALKEIEGRAADCQSTENMKLRLAFCASQADVPALVKAVRKQQRAMVWFEEYFRTNIDGGGKHGCPFCYGSSDEKDWSEMEHYGDCAIQNAAAILSTKGENKTHKK